MPRALVVGKLPKVPGPEDRQDLPGYLRLMGYLVESLDSLSDALAHLSKCDDYAFVVLTLCTGYSGDGFHLLNWLYMNGRSTPCIVVDEGILIAENRNRLLGYKNPVVEMLSPSDLGSDMQPLLKLIRLHAPLDEPIVKVPPEPEEGKTPVKKEEKRENADSKAWPWLERFFLLVFLAGLLGCVRLAILALDGAEKVSLNPMSAVAILALLGGFFGIFRGHAARALDALQKLLPFLGRKGTDLAGPDAGGDGPPGIPG